VKRVLKVPKAIRNDSGRVWTKLLTGVDATKEGRDAFLGPELPFEFAVEVPVGALLLGFAEERTPRGGLLDIHLALWQVPAEVPLVEHSRWRVPPSRWRRWVLLVQRDLEVLLAADLASSLSVSDAMLASQLAQLPPTRRAAVITAASRPTDPGGGTGPRGWA
jgi:hypothetical protein